MHHASLLLGSRADTERYLVSLLGQEDIALLGNPDALVYSRESFGVDDAREIREQALERAFGSGRIIVLAADRFTPEAQNALLKTLEEPIEHTRFFILGAERTLFLPTLLSRVKIIEVPASSLAESQFIALPLRKRLEFAKDFEGSLPVFFDSLLIDLKSKDAPLTVLKKVFDLRRYASDPAANHRLIVEHLALVL